MPSNERFSAIGAALVKPVPDRVIVLFSKPGISVVILINPL